MSLQIFRSEVEGEGESGPETVGGVEVDTGMIVQEVHERSELEPSHMGDGGGEVREPIEDLPEMDESHEFIPLRAIPDVEEEALFLFHDQLIEGEKPPIMGIQPLDLEVYLDPDDTGMSHHPFGVREGVAVVGMIRGETVQIGELFEEFDIPFVHRFRDTFSVGIVGKDDGGDAALVEVLDALPAVVSVEDLRPRRSEE